ncbi:hypothetical protein ACTHO0_25565 [Cytobacillus praedii]
MINNGAPLEVIRSLLGNVRLLNKAVALCYLRRKVLYRIIILR